MAICIGRCFSKSGIIEQGFIFTGRCIFENCSSGGTSFRLVLLRLLLLYGSGAFLLLLQGVLLSPSPLLCVFTLSPPLTFLWWCCLLPLPLWVVLHSPPPSFGWCCFPPPPLGGAGVQIEKVNANLIIFGMEMKGRTMHPSASDDLKLSWRFLYWWNANSNFCLCYLECVVHVDAMFVVFLLRCGDSTGYWFCSVRCTRIRFVEFYAFPWFISTGYKWILLIIVRLLSDTIDRIY